jgi:hypothetical protein
MKRAVIGAGLGIWFAVAGHAEAQTLASVSPVVVELYTSQGCSSCPPADALLGRLIGRPDVIALSLHVDYWDYLGWVDELAQPAFTLRQKAYAHVSGARAIYTPQMVVAGSDALMGADPTDLAALIAHYAGTPAKVGLQIGREGEAVRIVATATPPLERSVVLQIVRYLPEVHVKITHGENAGREADYYNVVTGWTTLAEWDGKAPLALTFAIEGPEPAVLIMQELRAGGKYSALPGPILAAARLD